MSEQLLQSLAWLAVLGAGSQWLAWRLHLPSILILLIVGFCAGPLTGLIKPDLLLGDLLMPFVSVAVSLIMFEGGLTLKFHELKDIGRVVRNLLTIGAVVTWLGASAAAHFALGWSKGLSAVFGAIVVVTGPTVIGPLLRIVQPTRQVSSILKWEGIVIDPVGAVLALLVFKAVVAGQGIEGFSGIAAKGFAKTILVGGLLGVLGGEFLRQVLKRYWVPDYLQSAVTLMTVVGLFTVSDHFQHESGLLTVTIMGIWLANQKNADVSSVLEFKENLRVLLIAVLFILLAARVELQAMKSVPIGGVFALLAIMMFLVRPLSVMVSAAGSKLTVKERCFISWMAPRGIVAAAVASIFAVRLVEAKVPRAEELVPVTFFLIIGTVAIYGLTAVPVAKALGVSSPNPQGILFGGANRVVRLIARALHEEGITVLLVDTNRQNLLAARMDGLPTHYGSVLSEHTLDHLDLSGIGRLLAMTPNASVNSLAAVQFKEVFGRPGVYLLPPDKRNGSSQQRFEPSQRGRVLFSSDSSFMMLQTRLDIGAEIRKTQLTEEFTFDDFRTHHGASALPLFLVNPKGELRVFSEDHPPTPANSWTLVSLIGGAPTDADTRVTRSDDGENP
ncbi:MAG: hypothetical protein CMO80_20065 [Verrucomicrobiales bacterium]|nr:hypothetical protein [Verrucomicrobiales bacterium]|tara:strand:+ start:35 stop:1882 length:1848 start_codon:yes stop_codon:yes gene_type:complete